MKKIVINLIRHGETEFNRLGKIQGSTNIDLSNVGINQAKEINLDTNKIYDISFHSSLSRSKNTLDIICNKLNFKPETKLNDDIIERGYGIFEGLTENEIKSQFPNKFNEWKANENAEIEGAETIENVLKRIKNFLKFIIQSGNKDILLVTHSGVLYCLYKYINNINLNERVTDIKFKNCSSNILTVTYNEKVINLHFDVENQTQVNRSCPTKEIITNS